MSDKNDIISKLVNEILENIEKDMPTEYKNALTNANGSFKSKEGGYVSEEKYQKNYIKSWIRSLVKNDYKSLCAIIPEEKILSYDEMEIIQLLKVLFFLRKETGDFFYRKENTDLNKKEATATKSINSNLLKGSLSHDYEGYVDFIVRRYNNQYGEAIFELKSELKKEDEYLKKIEESENHLLDALYKGDIDNFNIQWNQFLEFLNDLYKRVSMSVESDRRNMVIHLFEVERLLGTVRVVVYHMENLNFSSDLGLVTSNRYIELLKKKLDIADNLNSKEYSLIQNYILHTTMVSLRSEREKWIKIFDYLYEEKENEKARMDPEFTLRKYEVCISFKVWYTLNRKMIKDIDEEMLLRAIYKEIYVYKKIPKYVSNKGWLHLLNYIEGDEAYKSDNMDVVELFFYEKFKRGVYREMGGLEEYKKFNRMMRSFYEIEKTMFGEQYMNGGYLGNWINAIKNSLYEL